MKKTYFPIEGMNDVDHIKKPNVMDLIQNYEQRTLGKIEKRVDPLTFLASLNEAINASATDETVRGSGGGPTGGGGGFLGGTIIFIPEEPYYPQRKPSDMSEDWDYIIPVFGVNSHGEYILNFYYYTTSSTWESKRIWLIDQGIVYTAATDMIIKYVRDMALILDYAGNNEPHYVRIDEDQTLVYDLVRNSVSRPDKALYYDKPTDSGVNKDNYFTSDDVANLGATAIYRWFYTIINKYSDEGNPSPGSIPLDLLFKKVDTDDLTVQYVAQVTLKGFDTPVNASNQMLEEIKAYRLYRQWWDAENAVGRSEPQFVTDINVSDASSEISYTDTIQIVSTSPEISYANDNAPIARDGELVGNSILLSKIKKQVSLIGEWDMIHPITLNNLNTEFYPNGIICLKLSYDIIDNPSYLKPNLAYLLANKDKVRFFDSDLGTPIPALYYDATSGAGKEALTDPDFETEAGVNWICGTGWSIDVTLGYAEATAATGTIAETSVLADKNHIIAIEYDASLDGLIELDYGAASAITITKDKILPNGHYFYSFLVGGTGGVEDCSIGPVSARVTGKVYRLSAYEMDDDPVILFFLRVPDLLIGQKQIVLAFCFQASESVGVSELTHWQYNSTTYENGEYGEFLDIETAAQFAGQKVFTEGGLRDSALIYSPMVKLIDLTGKSMNRANQLNYAVRSDAPEANPASGVISNIPTLDFGTAKTISLLGFMYLSGINGSITYYDNTEYKYLVMPSTLTVGCRFSYNPANMQNTTDPEDNGIFQIVYNSNNFIRLFVRNDGALGIRYKDGGSATNIQLDAPFPQMAAYGAASAIYSYFIILSINTSSEACTIFVLDLANKNIHLSKSISAIATSVKEWVGENVNIIFGGSSELTYYGIPSSAFTYTFAEEKFYAGDSATPAGSNKNNENALVNLASFMPSMKTSIIGYNHVYGRYYASTIVITLTTTITIVGAEVADRFEDADELYISGGASDGILATISSVEESGGNTIIISSTTLVNQATGTSMMLTAKKYNENITIDNDDLEEVKTKESKNLSMYTNSNGMSFPSGNIKLADNEIRRIAKMPTTLAEMRNSLIMLFRNGFVRYIAEADPSTWADATNIKIPQLRRAGIIADYSMQVTPHGLVWLSEAGIQLLRSMVPELLSGGVNIPLKETYRSWYCRNRYIDQYGLHDQDYISESIEVTFSYASESVRILSDTTWAAIGLEIGDSFKVKGSVSNNGFHIIKAIDTETNTATLEVAPVLESHVTITLSISKTWIVDFRDLAIYTFRSIDMKCAMQLSGGSLGNNIMLFLTDFNQIHKYPDFENASSTTALAKIKKTIRHNYADFDNVTLKYDKATGNAQIKSTINDPVADAETTTAYASIENMRPKKLPINYIGDRLDLEIKDADEIEYFTVEEREMNNPY